MHGNSKIKIRQRIQGRMQAEKVKIEVKWVQNKEVPYP